MSNRHVTLAIVASFALMAGVVHAESQISASAATGTTLTTAARLNVTISVPRVLYLQVGATGATVNTITFSAGTSGFTGPLPVSGATPTGAPPFTTATFAAADDFGTSDGQVTARLWTNNGSVTLSCAATAPTSGGTTIPLTAITVGSTTVTGGGLPHPGANLACGAGSSTAVGTAGVNDRSSNWTFAYAPTVAPPAGQYTTQVTYTATQP